MANRIETGEARPDELDRILEVMCECFEMPYSAARTIYYADPYLDPRHKRVVRVDGAIVSCLTVVDTVCRIGHASVRMGGIAGVATIPEHRRKGYARLLLTDTLAALAAQGYVLTALFPFSRDYYRRLGWETCSVIWRCIARPGALPLFVNCGTLREANRADVPALDRLYAVRSQRCNLACLRDAKRWRSILDRTANSLVWERSDGVMGGYLLHDYRHGEIDLAPGSNSLPTLRIQEMVADDEDARRSMIGYLAAHCPAGGVEYGATWRDLEVSGLLDFAGDGDNIRVERMPGVMARILNLRALATLLSAGWTGFQGDLEIVMTDAVMNPKPQIVRVVGDGRAVPSIGTAQTAGRSLDSIVGDVRVWTQVAVGSLAVGDAAALGLLQATGDVASGLTATLFPRNTPFLPVPDHF